MNPYQQTCKTGKIFWIKLDRCVLRRCVLFKLPEPTDIKLILLSQYVKPNAWIYFTTSGSTLWPPGKVFGWKLLFSLIGWWARLESLFFFTHPWIEVLSMSSSYLYNHPHHRVPSISKLENCFYRATVLFPDMKYFCMHKSQLSLFPLSSWQTKLLKPGS